MKSIVFVLMLCLVFAGEVSAQSVLDQCITFTPATCPTEAKNRFDAVKDEFNLQNGTSLNSKEAFYEIFRYGAKMLIKSKHDREARDVSIANRINDYSGLDADLPTVIPTCGDNAVNQPSEECDGTDDSSCPGACLGNCTCPVPTTTTTTTTLP